MISFNKLSQLFPGFTCARAVGNLWRNCLGVNILIPVPVDAFNENNPLLKALTTKSLPS